MLFWIGSIIAAIAYTQIGIALGRVSIAVWHSKTASKTAEFILFPMEYLTGQMGDRLVFPWNFVPGDPDGKDVKPYLRGMAFLWPIKIAWNLAAAAVLGPLKATHLLYKFAADALIDGPGWIAKRLAPAANRLVARLPALSGRTERSTAKQLHGIGGPETPTAVSMRNRGDRKKDD